MSAKDQFRKLSGGIGAAWVREAAEQDASEENALGTKDGLVQLVYQYRYVSMLAQTGHWFVQGATSAQDHELFKTVYVKLNDHLDDCAERVVGTFELSPDDLSLAIQSAAVADMSEDFESDIAHDGTKMAALLMDELDMILEVIDEVVESEDITDGTRNLLEGQADEIDKLMYHLGRRTRA